MKIQPEQSDKSIVLDESIVKVCLVGDTNTGKSQFLNQYVNDAFSLQFESTIGIDWKFRRVEAINSQAVIKLKICDTAGQQRFRSITKQYYRYAQIIVLFVDVTRELADNRLEELVVDIQQQAPTARVLVAMSKADVAPSYKKFKQTQLSSYLKQLKLQPESIEDVSATNASGLTAIDNQLTRLAEEITSVSHNASPPSAGHFRFMSHQIRQAVNHHPYKVMVFAGSMLGVVLCATGVFAPFGMAALGLVALGIMGGVAFGLATFIIRSLLEYKCTVDLKDKYLPKLKGMLCMTHPISPGASPTIK